MMYPMAALAVMIALGGSSVAASPVQQAAPYRVFFDWGKSVVSQDGAATLDDVAVLLLQRGSRAVMIVGYSDRSGPAGANRQTALRRAEAVRDYLVRRGVPAALLRVSSRGEDALLIATADGVREPHNRRVDIEFATQPGR